MRPARGVRTALSGLTTRGRCLLSAGAALLAASLVLGQRDLLRAGVFLLALPLLAVAVVARTRYRLACTRTLDPTRAEVGSVAQVRVRLSNVSRLPSGVLLMEDALPYALGGRPRFVLDRVEPRGVREVSYAVRSDARGRYRVGPLSVRLADPFGLCELGRAFASSDELTVTPHVSPLPAVRLGGDWAGGGETSARTVAAAGTDDTTTREYRHGDDLRKVHWRSTARVGELMVRREEQPFQSRATLVLDTRGRSHRGDGPGSSFEWAVAATASIGVSLARAAFALTVLTDADTPLVPAGVQVTEGALLDALALVEPGDGRSLDPVLARLVRRGVDGVLIVVLGRTDLDDLPRLARLRQGSSGCVAVLLDVAGWGSAPGRPRSRTPSSERNEAAAALLAGAGWRVVPAGHDTELAAVWPLAGARAGMVAARAPAVPA